MMSMITHWKLPYAYMTRKDENPPDPRPDLLQGKPYSEAHGSIIMELVMCASWDHTLMNGERALLYDYLKIAWKGAYAMSILVGKLRNDKDGIKAFRQAVEQYAGVNRWEEIRDEAENLLQTTFYNGTGKYSLDTHATFQKRQFSKLESCADHVNTISLNEESKVSFLLRTANCNDQCFVTRKETVKEDPTYKKDYHKAANYLSVACPVKKKNKGSKEQVRSKSQVAATNINIKSGRGPKTGVDLRWYPSKEFNNLKQAEKEELREWSKTEFGKAAFEEQKATFLRKKKAEKRKRQSEGGGGSNSKGKFMSRAEVQAMIAEERETISSTAKVINQELTDCVAKCSSNSSTAQKKVSIQEHGSSILNEITKLRSGGKGKDEKE